MAQVSNSKHNADFWYWNVERHPTKDETFAIINHESPELKILHTKVNDIRQSDEKFHIDTHGFQVIKHHTAANLHNFLEGSAYGHEQKDLVEAYWPETRTLIKQTFGVRSVFINDSRFRRAATEPIEPPVDDKNYVPGKAQYGVNLAKSHMAVHFYLTHNPLSAVAARHALRAFKPDAYELLNSANSTPDTEQEEFWRLRQEIIVAEDKAAKAAGHESYEHWDGSGYEGPRWGVVNLNRPLEPVESSCYGVIDARSLIDIPGTLEERQQAYRSVPFTYIWKATEPFEGKNTTIRYPAEGKEHKWYWLSDQKPDELIAVKFYDSEAWLKESKVAPFTAWSAFDDPRGNGRPKVCLDTWGFIIY